MKNDPTHRLRRWTYVIQEWNGDVLFGAPTIVGVTSDEEHAQRVADAAPAGRIRHVVKAEDL